MYRYQTMFQAQEYELINYLFLIEERLGLSIEWQLYKPYFFLFFWGANVRCNKYNGLTKQFNDAMFSCFIINFAELLVKYN